ncbi:MAG TPA: DUF2188 domain-containing protein [Candidatus Paceibacterota bacterium]|nr:DUF2188 domain-containing protein [Candidatus Paceibacterota bacterium]
MKKNIHTVFNSERKMWESKLEGQEKPVSSSHKKDTAMEKSIKEAKERKVEHVIHNKDGIITDKDSYGKDPNPPKDAKH